MTSLVEVDKGRHDGAYLYCNAQEAKVEHLGSEVNWNLKNSDSKSKTRGWRPSSVEDSGSGPSIHRVSHNYL